MSGHLVLPAALLSDPGRRLDIVGIGTALVDHLGVADDAALAALGLTKGAMQLVDLATSERIRSAIGEQRQISGGTVANTAVGVASLGGRPAFVGAVATDALGDRYAADLEASGVAAILERLAVREGESETGRSVVVVTPDAERTMATTLGVGPLLDHDAIHGDLLASARLVYFDGYVLDFPDADRLVTRIVELARDASTPIALGLADPLVVRRHHRALTALIDDGVALLFANEAEATGLVGTDDVEEAVAALRRPGLVSVVTRGADGAVVATEEGTVEIDAEPVDVLVDATGAGDLFAAGVCFGVTHGYDLVRSARLGALAAAEAVTHLGARPEVSLAELAAARGLLGAPSGRR
ncbi:MAG TPA: adenosine kinase [Acidimicrobiales bacterium]|nr:adenosine kinase [Acidimicrobiales bacterium]